MWISSATEKGYSLCGRYWERIRTSLSGKDKTILASSVPSVYALDKDGKADWRFQINTTVYSMNAADLNSLLPAWLTTCPL